MKRDVVTTYKADIYLGLRYKYDGDIQPIEMVKNICQKYCDEVGACVTITETEFIYTEGNENGVIVGFIKYPRFPQQSHKIKSESIHLANLLMIELNQFRCSVVCSDDTIMLTNRNIQQDF